MFDPLEKIMVDYKPLLVIMQVVQISTQMTKVSVIKFSIISSILCDYTLWFCFLIFLLLSLVNVEGRFLLKPDFYRMFIETKNQIKILFLSKSILLPI
jgi:hypothetical protein